MPTIRLKQPSKTVLSISITLFFGIMFLSNPAHAELQELEDDKLEELHGKEGITIDLSFKLSIGEIFYDLRGRDVDDDLRQKTLKPPPPRIEYHQNGK